MVGIAAVLDGRSFFSVFRLSLSALSPGDTCKGCFVNALHGTTKHTAS